VIVVPCTDVIEVEVLIEVIASVSEGVFTYYGIIRVVVIAHTA